MYKRGTMGNTKNGIFGLTDESSFKKWEKGKIKKCRCFHKTEVFPRARILPVKKHPFRQKWASAGKKGNYGQWKITK